MGNEHICDLAKDAPAAATQSTPYQTRWYHNGRNIAAGAVIAGYLAGVSTFALGYEATSAALMLPTAAGAALILLDNVIENIILDD